MKGDNVLRRSQQNILRSRRRFLQLTGASALTLPFLRALPGYAQADAPTFLALTFKGNGVVRHTWGADKTGEGAGEIQFRETLAPLAGFEDYVTVVNGLKAEAADEAGGTHEGGMASVWTGRNVIEGAGASIDQLVAQRTSGTPRRSLEFRAMTPEDELNRTPNNRMIFDASGAAIDPREDAITAFDQLFAGVTADAPEETPDQVRRQLLFAHLDQQLASVSPKLCSEDRAHLDALRAGWVDLGNSLSQVVQCDPEDPRAITGEFAFQTSMRQMADILAMSFACGLTHVGSIQWSQALSNFKPVSLGVGSGQHHDISHEQPQAFTFEEYVPYPEDYWVSHVNDPTPAQRTQYADIWERLNTVDRFYMGELAYFLGRLQNFPSSAGGTLLDQTLVVFSSELDNGSGHDHYNMPYLLAGGSGGRLRRGTVIDLPLTSQQIEQNTGKPSGLRYHNDLLVTIAHLVGHTDVTSMGPSHFNQGPLTELML